MEGTCLSVRIFGSNPYNDCHCTVCLTKKGALPQEGAANAYRAISSTTQAPYSLRPNFEPPERRQVTNQALVPDIGFGSSNTAFGSGRWDAGDNGEVSSREQNSIFGTSRALDREFASPAPVHDNLGLSSIYGSPSPEQSSTQQSSTQQSSVQRLNGSAVAPPPRVQSPRPAAVALCIKSMAGEEVATWETSSTTSLRQVKEQLRQSGIIDDAATAILLYENSWIKDDHCLNAFYSNNVTLNLLRDCESKLQATMLEQRGAAVAWTVKCNSCSLDFECMTSGGRPRGPCKYCGAW